MRVVMNWTLWKSASFRLCRESHYRCDDSTCTEYFCSFSSDRLVQVARWNSLCHFPGENSPWIEPWGIPKEWTQGAIETTASVVFPVRIGMYWKANTYQSIHDVLVRIGVVLMVCIGLYPKSNVWIDFFNTCSIQTKCKLSHEKSVCIEHTIQTNTNQYYVWLLKYWPIQASIQTNPN